MRALRNTLIAVAVIALIGVGVDRVAKVVVEGQAERHIQETYGLTSSPHVTVGGFPFLTQILRRDLQRVSISAVGVPLGSASALSVEATARDVELLPGYEGRAASVTGTLTVPYADLIRLAQDAGEAFDVSYGGEPGVVAIDATVDLPTGPVAVRALSEVLFAEQTITVALASLEVDGTPAPTPVRQAVGDRLDFAIRLPTVPGVGEVGVQAVTATDNGVLVTVAGTDIAVG